MKTIEELKSDLIKQAKEESQVEYDVIGGSVDEIIERAVHFAFDIGYEKGYYDKGQEDLDCGDSIDNPVGYEY
jgi:hypothetical protein